MISIRATGIGPSHTVARGDLRRVPSVLLLLYRSNTWIAVDRNVAR